MAEETGSVETGNPVEADAPAEATSATSTPWIDGVTSPDTRSWAESKGLQNGTIDNVLGSYHNLEKLMGADKAGRTVTMLGDDATPEQRNEFYGKLGRPDNVDGYTFKLAEGADTARLDAMRNKAHDLGITDSQFSGLAEADIDYLSTINQTNIDEAAISKAEAELQLKKEWGAAYELKVAGIEVAAQKLGFNDDQLSGLHKAMGPVEAMKFVDSLNTKMGDHKFESGDLVNSNHKTPAQAETEMQELSMNREFMDAWLDRGHPGHKAAVEKKSTLARLASGVV
jgi:hypothetical protein|tara:strand:- start:372 stop:1223 length:852 start_codon:yes stop_codon:yes gene_type:complete